MQAGRHRVLPRTAEGCLCKPTAVAGAARRADCSPPRRPRRCLACTYVRYWGPRTDLLPSSYCLLARRAMMRSRRRGLLCFALGPAVNPPTSSLTDRATYRHEYWPSSTHFSRLEIVAAVYVYPDAIKTNPHRRPVLLLGGEPHQLPSYWYYHSSHSVAASFTTVRTRTMGLRGTS